MRGLGTIINVACIVFGGLLGLACGKKLKARMQETVLIAEGIALVIMSLGGVIERMISVTSDGLSSSGTIMMIISLVAGAILGELLDIDGAIERFGVWLKKKTGNENDSGFVSAFVAASCTVCIGAMAVMGSIADGVSGNYSILLAKGLCDFIVICIMTAAQGKGCIFSAIPVAICQGIMTLIAALAGDVLPQQALSNLSYVGNILILCVGLNLVFDRKIRVANLLPSIVIAAAWGCF